MGLSIALASYAMTQYVGIVRKPARIDLLRISRRMPDEINVAQILNT